MLNWFVWKVIDLFETEMFGTLKLYLHNTELLEIKLFLPLTICKQKAVFVLNWIVWNRTVYMYKNGFGIKQPTMVDRS